MTPYMPVPPDANNRMNVPIFHTEIMFDKLLSPMAHSVGMILTRTPTSDSVSDTLKRVVI